PEPSEDLLAAEVVSIVRPITPSRGPEGDLGQRRMVHLRRMVVHSPVLDVAFAATPDPGMKRRRLTLEERLIVGVAGDAFTRIRSPRRGVARGAVVFQRGMGRRQPPRTGLSFPGRRPFRARPGQ